MQDCFSNNNGVKINYKVLEISAESSKPSIFFVHGALGSADDWILNDYLVNELQKTNINSFFAVNLRGHATSDFPQSGFSVKDHISDIKSIIEQEKLSNVVLIAHSLGVPYVIGYSLDLSENVTGIVVGDYVALIPQFSEGWLNSILPQITDFNVNPNLPYRLKEEIEYTTYIDQLEKLKFPFLIIRGMENGGVLGSDDAIKMWNGVQNKSFYESQTGHDVFQSENTVDQIIGFINDL